MGLIHPFHKKPQYGFFSFPAMNLNDALATALAVFHQWIFWVLYYRDNSPIRRDDVRAEQGFQLAFVSLALAALGRPSSMRWLWIPAQAAFLVLSAMFFHTRPQAGWSLLASSLIFVTYSLLHARTSKSNTE